MASRPTHDVVATVGEYTDQHGEKKKRYFNVGKAFTNDEGNISIKLDGVPVSPEWSGWLSLFPVKERDQDQRSAPPRQQQRPPARQQQRPPQRQARRDYGDGPITDGMDDEIPFN